MNDLTPEKRQQLKILVLLITIIFCVSYGTTLFVKYTQQSSLKLTQTKEKIIFEQPKLKFFQYAQELNLYPDRITIHYPYLVILRPNEQKSEIYNMDSQRKEREVSEVLLDYFKEDMVYNKQGYTTYFNKKDLQLLCDQAFIKSKTEILCITRPDHDKQDNKLISINPQTLEQKNVYSSQNVLTAVYFDKKTLYLGEYDFTKNKAFVTVNNQTSPVGDLVNVLYPMGDTMYAASFKSLRNKQMESYYEVTTSDKNVSAKLIKRGEIIFYN